jgi:hypothetical protein
MNIIKDVIAIKSYSKRLVFVLSPEALVNTKKFILGLPGDKHGKEFPLENDKDKGFKLRNESDMGFAVVESYNKGSKFSEFYCTMKIDNAYGFTVLIIDFKYDQSIHLQESGYRFDDYDGFLKLLQNTIGIDLNVRG